MSHSLICKCPTCRVSLYGCRLNFANVICYSTKVLEKVKEVVAGKTVVDVLKEAGN